MNPNQVRQVAERQRALVWTIFAVLLLSFANGVATAAAPALGGLSAGLFPLALLLLLIAAQLWALFCLVRLLVALEVSTVILVFAIILMFMPCLSLIVLVGFNMQATKFLRGHGLRVGLLGVDPKDMPPPAL
ncbi:MAG TPA: hypothetical protein PKE47_09715 [Verrucomicrobiota bacterium]|nr:hypothetical protein [Verrucomicrobiota bacterium]